MSQVAKTVIFKVAFLSHLGMGYKEEVSRVIELKESQTLVDLHESVLKSTGWDDESHLYSFFMDGKAWSDTDEYHRPENIDEAEKSWGYRPKTADIELKALNLHPKQRFLYIFDFGDEHHFKVKVKGFGEVEEGVEYPRILESVGKFPPQYPDEETGE